MPASLAETSDLTKVEFARVLWSLNCPENNKKHPPSFRSFLLDPLQVSAFRTGSMHGVPGKFSSKAWCFIVYTLFVKPSAGLCGETFKTCWLGVVGSTGLGECGKYKDAPIRGCGIKGFLCCDTREPA